jgi:hypothetical protein
MALLENDKETDLEVFHILEGKHAGLVVRKGG